MNTNGAAIALLDKEAETKDGHADWCAQQALNHEELAAGYRQREDDARQQAAALRNAKNLLSTASGWMGADA